ncbi:MAG TPA: hypothetical protein VGE55_06480 [Limnobacter sp.]|uniref:hypothetical protein n=1 Tax=Limnobacter sp. TaxID=2003368 RepID=UPI002EDB75C0
MTAKLLFMLTILGLNFHAFAEESPAVMTTRSFVNPSDLDCLNNSVKTHIDQVADWQQALMNGLNECITA